MSERILRNPQVPRRWIPIVAAALACAARPHPAPAGADDSIVVEDVTVVSPERDAPLSHAYVTIRQGRIAAVASEPPAGTSSRKLDGRGRFLVPGLIDSHVHIGNPAPVDDEHPTLVAAFRAQLPRSYLAFGFTTLVDLDSSPESRASFDVAPLRPRLLHCGTGVRIAGGYGVQRVPQTAGAAEKKNLVYEPAQAERWPAAVDPREFTPERAVERVAGAGGVCVKTFVEPGFGGAFHWPVPRRETLAALQAAAYRRGMPFVVHANGAESWKEAIAARADVIAHGLWHWSGPVTDRNPTPEARDAIALASQAKVAVQPTLQTVYGDESVFDSSILADPRISLALPHAVIAWVQGDQGAAARRALADEYRGAIEAFFGPARVDPAAAMSIGPARATATLRLMLAAGVRVVFGSDTGSSEGIGNPPGLNGRFELQRWSDAGATPLRILRAATLDNAAVFGIGREVGSVEAGKRADLLLLRANPLDGVAAYDAIETIFVDGAPIPRTALAPVD